MSQNNPRSLAGGDQQFSRDQVGGDDDLFPWPFSRLSQGSHSFEGVPPDLGLADPPCVLGKRSEYHALRIGTILFLSATVELEERQVPKFRQDPVRIFPPRFQFLVCGSRGALPTLRRRTVVDWFGYPESAPSVTVKDADGLAAVEIQDVRTGHLLKSGTSATDAGEGASQGYIAEGMGFGGSLQSAFDAAVAQVGASGHHDASVFVLHEAGSFHMHRIPITIFYARVIGRRDMPDSTNRHLAQSG